MIHFQLIARCLQFLSIFGALFVLFQPALVSAAVLLDCDALRWGDVTFRVPSDMTVGKALLQLLPNAIVALGLGYLSQFGNLLAKGASFDRNVSGSLHKAAILFVVGVIISWVIEPFITSASFAVAFIQLLENHGLLLLISFAFSLVSILLRQAHEIEAENKEFY